MIENSSFLSGSSDLPKSGHHRVDTIQALRAIAALMVLLFHAQVDLISTKMYPGVLIWRPFSIGYAGVEIFFVISGFIIFSVHKWELGRSSLLPRYAVKRFIRIYPIYWIATVGIVLLYALFPDRGLGTLRDPDSIFTSLTLLPSEQSPVLIVAWTLRHEMLFYLIFSILFINIRIGSLVLFLWFLLCASSIFGFFHEFPFKFYLSSYNVLFAFGIVSAYIHTRISRGMASGLIVVGIIGFLTVGLAGVYGIYTFSHDVRTILYGLSAAMFITGLAAAEIAFRLRVWFPLIFLGNASYSIYLIHGTAMHVAADILLRLHVREIVPPLAVFLAVIPIGLSAGIALHFFLEKPLLFNLNRAILSWPLIRSFSAHEARSAARRHS